MMELQLFVALLMLGSLGSGIVIGWMTAKGYVKHT